MTSAAIKKIVIARRNNIEIGPVIARGITFLFGHLFLAPFTKLIMAMIKHGMKIKRIAKTMSANAIQTSTPKMPMRIVTKNAPINAMTILYIFYELIAIVLKHHINEIRSFTNDYDCYDYRNNDKWCKQSSFPFILNAFY